MRLGYGLGGARPPVGGGPVAPPAFNPLTDASHLVFIGASLESRAFSAAAEQTRLNEIRSHLGFLGSFDNRAGDGDLFSDTLNTRLPAIEAAYASTAATAFAIVDRSGNDVTASRPYAAGQQASYRGNLDAIATRLAGLGMRFAPVGLTKRFYTTAPTVSNLTLSDASEANGSKPYNDTCVYPWIQAVAPDWWDAPQGAPWLDGYGFTNKTRWLVTTNDGTHLHTSLEPMWIDYLLTRIKQKYSDARASLGGRSILCAIRPQTEYLTAATGFNRIMGFHSLIRDTAGVALPHLVIQIEGGSTPFNGGGTSTATVADSRLTGFQDFYVTAGTVQTSTRHDFIRLKISGLAGGQSGVLTLSGSRASTSGASDRRGLVQISGGAAGVLDAATGANNQLVLPFTAPADGRLEVLITPQAGSTFAYLCAFALDF